MRNNFQIIALQEKEFNNLFLMDEEELKILGQSKWLQIRSPDFLQGKLEGCRNRRRSHIIELSISFC